VGCGSNCEAGFYASATSQCLKTTSTSDNFGMSLGVQQARVGCAACAVQGPRYVKGGTCQYICYRDLTGETSVNDTYCSVQARLTDGTCPTSCLLCRVSLAARQNEYSYNAQMYASKYIDSCKDIVGHAWQTCDASGKPRLATFVKGTTVVGARTGCEWACPSPTTYSYGGTCLACTDMAYVTSTTCRSGERRVSCDSKMGLGTCIPCEGHTLQPLQVWTSSFSDYFSSCTEDCEPGVGYAAVVGAPCQRCSNAQCVLGERFVACTPREDARCDLCSVGYGPLGTHEEYVTAGLCSTRCVSGYYYDGSQCVECLPTTGACALGMKQTTRCLDVSERKSAPLCTACTWVLQAHQVWALRSANTGACAIGCTLGYVLSPLNVTSCVPCKTSLCPMGKRGTCTNSWSTTYLDCDANCGLTLGPHEEFVEAGSCEKQCVKEFAWSDYALRCVARKATVVVPQTTSVPMEPTTGVVYPVRARQHSGMSST